MMMGSVTEAARYLSITQPAVTRLISDLEFHLGFRLFERKSRGMKPTADAQVLFAEVERSFVGLDRIAEVAEAIQDRAVGTLRVVAQPVYADTVVSTAIGKFLKTRPRVRIMLESAPLHRLVELVSTRQYDLGVCSGLKQGGGVRVSEVGSQRAVAVRARQPGRNGIELSLDTIAKSRMVTLLDESPFRQAVVRHMNENGLVPDFLCEVRTQQAVCRIVRENSAVAIVDSCMRKAFPGDDVEFLEISPPLQWSVVAITPADTTLSGIETALETAIREEFYTYNI